MEVVTPNRSRDIRFTRDITSKSRHLEKVATPTLNQKRSRHHSVVATSVASKEGHDVIQWSRHQLQRKEGRDII